MDSSKRKTDSLFSIESERRNFIDSHFWSSFLSNFIFENGIFHGWLSDGEFLSLHWFLIGMDWEIDEFVYWIESLCSSRKNSSWHCFHPKIHFLNDWNWSISSNLEFENKVFYSFNVLHEDFSLERERCFVLVMKNFIKNFPMNFSMVQCIPMECSFVFHLNLTFESISIRSMHWIFIIKWRFPMEN